MSFSNILSQLLESKGVSNVTLGKAIGVSDVAVMRWRKGDAVPSLDNAINIANYFGISLDYLAGIKRQLESESFVKLPVLGTVSAYVIHQYGLPTGKYVFTSKDGIDNYPDHECYALYVEDNTFGQVFPKQTCLYIHQQKQCADGDWVIYQKMDTITENGNTIHSYSLRKFIRNNCKIELTSPNPNVEKIVFRKQDINLINIQGVVINSESATS